MMLKVALATLMVLCSTQKAESSTASEQQQQQTLRRSHSHPVAAASRALQSTTTTTLAGGLYIAKSDVSDHARLDLDQAAMEELLKVGDFDGASLLYTKGGYSKAYATLHVTAGQFAVPKDLKLEIITDDGTRIHGKSLELEPVGSTIVKFRYDDQGDGNTCHVGGLPASLYDLEGCVPPSGNLQIAGQVERPYNYEQLTENLNGRTLMGRSTKSKAKFHDCLNCPYSMYEDYNKYYGNFQYGHEFASAAIRRGETEDLTNGVMDFSQYNDIGRAEIMKKATAYMSVWMYVIGEMEDALDDCESKCLTCNDDSVHAWDEAVAFYSGSKENSGGPGVMIQALADKRCENFKTCGEDLNQASGMSNVNIEVFRHFRAGQNDLALGNCDAARKQKESIESFMIVPLIQGLLRYAWINDYQSETVGDKENAEGAIFAATVLPLIHTRCGDTDGAEFIYKGMKANSEIVPGFMGIKSRLERNYKCLGITCQDVGGLYDVASFEYLLNASPCGGGSGNRTAAIVGIVLGLLIAVLAIVICKMQSNRSSDGKDNSYVPSIEVTENNAVVAPPASLFANKDIGSETNDAVVATEEEVAFDSAAPAPVVDDVAANDASDTPLPPIA